MAIEGELKDLRDQVAGVGERVSNNTDAITGLDGRVAGLDSRVAGLDSRVTGLDSRVTGLDSRVQRLTAEVNDLRTEQSRAFADVLTVLQDVRNHTAGIPSLSERLQRAREAIDFLGRKALKPEDYEQLRAIAGL